MSYAFFMRYPSFQHERELFAFGHLVIGVDEAGCGCLAGPVIAAAVHLPLNSRIGILNDSKLLRREKREEILKRFIELGMRWTVGMADASEVDCFNVRQATLLAMRRAVLAFREATRPSRLPTGQAGSEAKPISRPKGTTLFALVDAWTIPHIKIPQRGIIHGDRLVKSIAAASIIAKVVRDRLMEECDAEFPGYQFAKHKGYGTALHRKILKKLGPSPLHRQTFLKKLMR